MINAIKDSFSQMNANFDDSSSGVGASDSSSDSSYGNDVITYFEEINLGMAAQTPAGLMVPVIHHAEILDLWGLAAEITRLAGKARDNTLEVHEMSGATITVTSLGSLGGLSTTPIINKPEVAIIGPNKIRDKLVLEDGLVVKRKVMNLSSSFDHRVIDGVDAAEFVQAIRAQLEHPSTLFI